MAAKYYTTLTTYGAQSLAEAAMTGEKLQLTHMAVGDGGGFLPVPDPEQAALIRETYRAAVNRVEIDPHNPGQIITELLIPENTGGWWLREVGLYDAGGKLFAVANCPEAYKPVLAEGSGRNQLVRLILIVSETASVELKTDPAVVLATRQYVDDAIIVASKQTAQRLAEHEQSRNHPDATLSAKGFTQLSSATDSAAENMAATPRAVKAVRDEARNTYAYRSITINRQSLASNVNITASDVNAWSKTEADARYLLKTGGSVTWLSVYQTLSVGTNATVGNQLTVKGSGFITKSGWFQRDDTMNVTNGFQLQGKNSKWVNGYFEELIGQFAQMVFEVYSDGAKSYTLFRTDGTLQIMGSAPKLMAGSATLFGDGNITGSKWGGYLSDYIKNNFISDIRLGANQSFGGGDGTQYAPPGYVVTAIGDFGADDGYGECAPIQYLRGGVWVTVGV
ncbi:TPA: hypothetical protein JS563_000719 [Serratia marcescens]|nr:hypothetical protein [Serratia marcescens]